MSRPILLTGLPTPARDALAGWLGCTTTDTEAPLEPTTKRDFEGSMWCSADAVWHLEELSDKLPDFRLVAGYQPPAVALDRLFATSSGDDRSKGELLEQWCHYHERLLTWRAQAPNRCLIFNADHVGEVFDRLQSDVLKLIGAKNRRAARAPRLAPVEHSARATLFAVLLEKLSPRAIDIYRELEGVASLYGRAPDFDSAARSEAITVDLLMQQWSLSAHNAASLPRLLGANQDAQSRISAMTAELELTRQAAESKSVQLRAQLNEAQKNHDVAVEHLHKRQEDLERLIATRDQQAKAIAERDQKIAVLTKSRDEATQRAAELDKQLKAAILDKEQIGTRITALERENELTILQLHQVQEELEQVFIASEQRKDELKAANERVEELRRDLSMRPSGPDKAPAAKHEPAETGPTTQRHDVMPGLSCGLASLQFARMSAEYWQVALSAMDIRYAQISLASAQVLLEWFKGEFLIKLRPGESGFDLEHFHSEGMPQDDWGPYVHIALADPKAFVETLSQSDRETLRVVIAVFAETLHSDTGIDAQTTAVRFEIAKAVELCASLADMLADSAPPAAAPAKKSKKEKRAAGRG